MVGSARYNRTLFIRLDRSDAYVGPHDPAGPSVANRLEGTLSEAELDALLSRVASVIPPAGWTWVLFGYGSSPRSRYQELTERENVDVLWSGSFVPWFLHPLSWIAAAHGGLLQVHEPSALPPVFRTLATQAMVEAYLVAATTVPALVVHANARTWRSRIGGIAEADAGYFCVGVDGDVIDPAIDFQGWASYGASCSQDLVDALRVDARQPMPASGGPGDGR